MKSLILLAAILLAPQLMAASGGETFHMGTLDADFQNEKGSFAFEQMNFSQGAIEASVTGQQFGFSIFEDSLRIVSDDHSIVLKLGNFQNFFKEDSLSLENANVFFRVGDMLKVRVDRLGLALNKGRQLFSDFTANCKGKSSRDLTDEIVGLCLHQLDATLGELSIPRGKLLLDNSVETFNFHLRDAVVTVREKLLKMSGVLKWGVKFKVSFEGEIDYLKEPNRVAIKVYKAKWWKFNFKKILLKVLGKLKYDNIKVEGETIFFFLQ